MARVTRIINVRSEGDNRLHVELRYESERSNGASVAKNMCIDRGRFLNWEQFQLAMEDAGIRSVVEAGSRLKGDNLREDWEYWKARVAGL